MKQQFSLNTETATESTVPEPDICISDNSGLGKQQIFALPMGIQTLPVDISMFTLAIFLNELRY